MSARQYLIVAALVVIATGAIAVRGAISGRALETHEVFVAQTAREMIARGDYIVPMFGGELRLQKPPLMYWAVVGVAKATGRPDVPPWVARLPSALSAMVLVGACIGIGARVYDRRTGLLAGAMVGFSAAVFEFGANARPEMLYAACTGLAILGFVSAVRATDRKHALWWALLAWVCFGLAILAKGPQLPVLMLLGLSFWWIRSSGWKAWARTVRPVMGLIVVTAVVAPWVIALMMRVDDPFGFWTNQLVGERFESKSGSGFVPWILAVLTPRYLAYVVVLLLPWGVLAPVAFFVPWQRHRADLAAGRDLFWAMVVPIVVLSLATRARDYYLLPVLPPIGVLLARGSIDLFEKLRRSPRMHGIASIAVWALAGGAVVCTVIVEVLSKASASQWVVVAVVFAIAGVSAACVARSLPPAWRAAPVVAALCAWAAAFGALGHETVLGNERPEHIDKLAIATAHGAGESMAVISIGFDRDDLIYRVNRPIRKFQRDVTPETLVPLAPAIIVATPKVLDRLVADGLGLERGEVFVIEGTESYEVARLGSPQNE